MKTNNKYDYIILGLGKTGQAVANYLFKNSDLKLLLMDVSKQSILPGNFIIPKHCDIEIGTISKENLFNTKCIVLSPGVSPNELPLEELNSAGVELISEIELFARLDNNKHKLIGITGTNGKSTVTNLVESMFQAAGESAVACGNFGLPLISLLDSNACWLIVELSSFQLEYTFNLPLEIACLLNVTEDHLDRHSTLSQYANVKRKIYQHAKKSVVNYQDQQTYPDKSLNISSVSFGLNGDWSYIQYKDKIEFRYGSKEFITLSSFTLTGAHNIENALAAISIAHLAGLPAFAIKQGLQTVNSLPHRTELVAKKNGVCWYNDSKATTPAAAKAALIGINSIVLGKVILILGGQAKGASFEPLCKIIPNYCKLVILLGEAASQIQALIKNSVKYVNVSSLKMAVSIANEQAKFNDAVLLAPACASFDMFDNYVHRGEQFVKEVINLLES